MILDDASITNAICETIAHLDEGNLARAAACLDRLKFEQLIKPATDRVVPKFNDKAAEKLGLQRVYETGDYLRLCRRAIDAGYLEAAETRAKAALARWTQQ